MLSNYDKQRLGEYLGEQADVLAAFLFGSVARGADRPDSDLDIAVLLEHAEEVTPLRAATLLSAVMAIAGRDDVDLVVLNSATPLLKHRIARDGEVLYARSNTDVAEFVIRAMSEFVDTQPLRDLQREQMHRRLRESQARQS